MSIDLHTVQIQGFFDGPVDHLFALPVLADYVEDQLDRDKLTVVSPTPAGSASRALVRPAGAPLAIIHKRRDPDVANQVKVTRSSAR